MQSLSKWSSSPHLQYSLRHVGTAAYQMSFNNLATQGLTADRVKAFQLIH